MKLNIDIEVSGKNIFVGTIEGTDSNDARFTYDLNYLDNGCKPISVNLPLTEEIFSPDITRLYFEGLLPEGFTKTAVTSMLRVNDDDYISVISSLGKEVLGAIRVYTDADTESSIDYKELDADEVKKLASEGAGKSAELVVQSHLSLAGATGKVGLYYDDNNDKWLLPLGVAPSSHIVKQSHVRLRNIVVNEQLMLMTAKKLGIDVCESSIINLGDYSDSNILLATKRYDRLIDDDSRTFNHLKIPYRLHQEDFAQACGISSNLKYEKAGDNYLAMMFDVIKKYSSNPIEDQQKLWKIVVFNYLVGNNDGHIKNYSLLHNKDMSTLRLAPAYDLLSTIIYDESSKDMAFNIGGEYNLDKINRENFNDETKKLNLSNKLLLEHFDYLKADVKKTLTLSAEELCDFGYTVADDIKNTVIDRRGL